MATVTAQQQKWLLKKFHTLCARLNMDADMKLALISGYGVESSKDLTNAELLELCDKLNEIANPEDAKIDKMRKRVIAAIGGWLRMIGKGDEGINYIKGVACQAAKVDNFNKIPLERLTTIYNMFLRKQKDAKSVNEVVGKITYEVRFGTDSNLLN
ncbi:hypothetical protein [Sangeribacter muris]|uniref:hypothetical protein n=1 Tax=Sangeribacter muris TaxID=2880703 RepID=UPI00244E490E|nr:hypothetical protein [Sangeribacter muris]